MAFNDTAPAIVEHYVGSERLVAGDVSKYFRNDLDVEFGVQAVVYCACCRYDSFLFAVLAIFIFIFLYEKETSIVPRGEMRRGRTALSGECYQSLLL